LGFRRKGGFFKGVAEAGTDAGPGVAADRFEGFFVGLLEVARVLTG
jgi:hypothetical protein